MTVHQKVGVYGFLATLVVAMIMAITPAASAQPLGIDPKTMGECMSRETDKAAAKQMVKENSVEKPEGWREVLVLLQSWGSRKSDVK